MDPALLIAQVEHGPPGGLAIAHLALLALVVLGGLAFVVVRGVRKGSGHDHERERGPER